MRNEFCIKLIKKYQENKQVIGSGHCKFYPTCSNYAIETYKKFNFFYASLLVGIRILRCNPLAKRRYYPVKLTKEEKQTLKFIKDLKSTYQTDFIDYCLSLEKDPNINEEYFNKMVFNYINLPLHPIFSLDINHPLIFQSRFIITKQEYIYNNKPNDNINYLEILNILFEKNLISYKYNNINEEFNNSYNLIPIESLSVIDILNLFNINNGVVIINNYNDSIKYKDFDIINVNKKNIKEYIDLDKVILIGSDLDIFEYLDKINFSINFYEDINQSNQFYHLNKKRF